MLVEGVLGSEGDMGAEEEGTGETDIMRPGEEAAEGEFRETSRLLRQGSDEDLKLTGSMGDFPESSPSGLEWLPLWVPSVESEPEWNP